MQPHLISEIAQLMGGNIVSGVTGALVTGICTDSRLCEAGDIFFALKGEQADGHDFVLDAMKAGAMAAVVSSEWFTQNQPTEGNYIITDDPLQALGKMAKEYRRRFNIPIVAITGSAGKTTTREMTAAILRQKYSVLVSPANYNTEIGVPVTLMDLADAHQAAVLEFAMRGLGQIQYLAEIARPVTGVVTNVGVSHLEILGSRDNIAKAKGELIASLPADGCAVLNADDDFCGYMQSLHRGPKILFGKSPEAQVRATEVSLNADGCAVFNLTCDGEKAKIRLRAPGEFQVMNALAATAVGINFGITLAQCADALSGYEGFEKRYTVHDCLGGWRVVDDSYNASPAAMKGMLEALGAMSSSGRKIAVLGDMRELGEDSEKFHQQVGETVASVAPDCLILVGSLASAIGNQALSKGYLGEIKQFESSDEAARYLVGDIRKGDLVLVKGSRAMKMESIVEQLIG